MIQLTPQTRVFLAVDPVDFRRQIDGLAQVCRQLLDKDPFSGAVFVFRNRSRTAIRLLSYDGQGYWICSKRFSKGKINWWPSSANTVHSLTHRALQILLWNGNPAEVSLAEDWKKVA